MNKLFRWLSAAILPVTMLASCTNDDPVKYETVEVSSGVFVINQGLMSANLSGSITYCSYESGKATQEAFSKINSQVLGDTPQDAITHGSKLYVAVYQSNLIRVIDRVTLKLIKDIRPEAEQGTQPRYLAANDDKVYVTMFDGYVARIDTTSLTIDASVKVGPNPDGIDICKGHVYAANSDGMNYLNGYADGKTVSKIDLRTMKEVKKIEVGLNPGPMAATAEGVYVVTRGNYGDIPAEVKRIKSDDSVESLMAGTMISSTESDLYVVNSPVFNPQIESVIRISDSGERATISIDPIAYPAAFGIDPVDGDIFFTAYNSTGVSADYTGPGYALRLDSEGNTVTRFDVGLNPCALTFNSSYILRFE